jgi:hypothetical protein
MSKINILRKRIMRRIYYAFALRLATHPFTVHAAILLLSVFALSRLTHVQAILNNFQSIQIGSADTFILNMLVHAEFWTLVCAGIVFFTLLSLPLRLSLPRFDKTSMA